MERTLRKAQKRWGFRGPTSFSYKRFRGGKMGGNWETS